MYDVHVAFHARSRPRAPAVITPRRRVTYGEFGADVDRYAAGLAGLGLGPGAGVVCVETSAVYRQAVLLTALARLGIATGAVRDTRADLRISDLPGASTDRILRLSRGWLEAVEQSPPAPVPPAPRDPAAPARVLMSSGTTGEPRRSARSWAQVDADTLNVLGAFAAGRTGLWIPRTGIDSSLGHNMAMAGWTAGACVALGFLSQDLPPLMERHPAGLIGATPMQLQEMLRALPAGFEPKPAWRVVAAGAALTAPLIRAARSRLTPDLVINYGTTETSRICVGPALRAEADPGFCGWPAPGVTVEIVDPVTHQPLPDGEQGLVRVRSPFMADGYIDAPEPGPAFFRDGFFHPGDLGRRLPDGAIVLDGRGDERMNIGGIKLLPGVIEAALLEHPQVADCASFSVADAEQGEACWVAVVVEGEVSRDALTARLRAAGLKLPARFAWTDAIPRNEMGKVDRAALRRETAAALAKAAPADDPPDGPAAGER